MTRTVSGLDTLRTEPTLLAGRRIGLLAHAASVDEHLDHAIDVLRALPGCDLRALFGPEHGLRGAAAAGDHVADARDGTTGLPVFSLYGDRLTPTPEQLDLIDALVIDLQDVGVRFLTYYVTVVHCLRACAAAGKRAIVLDRPNPIGGEDVEGPVLGDALASFVGLAGLPIRHGLTMGELARYFAARERLDLDLTVVPVRGWQRSQYFDQTSMPWVAPSPNIPTLETAIVYPGTCLVESTLASEGRGTTQPFLEIGAPGVDAEALSCDLRGRLPGAAVRPCWFVPTAAKHAGALCGGVYVLVTDRRAFAPVMAGLELLAALRRVAPEAGAWRPPATAMETDGVYWIDRLSGSVAIRRSLEAEIPVAEIVATWRDDLADYREARRPALLY